MGKKLARLIPIVVATVLAVGVAIGTATMSGKSGTSTAAAPIRTEAELVALERMAEAACRCERATGKPGTCWEDYRNRTAGLSPLQMASACAPVSTEIECFMVNGKESCIVTGRNGSQLCSGAEAEAFEAAYNGAMERSLRTHPGDMERADRAANAASERVMDSIRRGIVPPVDHSSQGCS